MAGIDRALNQIAADFESFVLETKLEHVDLFLPEIAFWRCHFPDCSGERMLSMRSPVERITKFEEQVDASTRLSPGLQPTPNRQAAVHRTGIAWRWHRCRVSVPPRTVLDPA